MVRNISRIEVFPAYMDIYFDSWALMGLSSENVSPDVKDETDKLTVFRAGQAYRTSHQPMMEEEKGIILGLMEQNPKVTAKEILLGKWVDLTALY